MAHWAIIGSGLAGVTLAKELATKHGVTIFEKSHSIAGRMATRRRSADGYEFSFDHGAQYFTIKGDGFQNAMQPYLDQGIVQPWSTKMVTITGDGIIPRPSSHPIYVASPSMTGLVKAMATGLDIRHKVEIKAITPTPDATQSQWMLTDSEDNHHGPFDGVVTAIPAHQAAQLIPEAKPALDQVKMLGCFTIMMGFGDDQVFRQDLRLDWPEDCDAAYVEDSPLGFVAVNSSKPGRGNKPSVVVQANNAWADTRLDEDPNKIETLLHQEIKSTLGFDAEKAAATSFHRWRYAATQTPLGQPYWRHECGQLAAIGDWCIKGRVEAAYDSAMALAQSILQD